MAVRELAKGEEARLLPLVIALWPDAHDYGFKDDAILVWDEDGALGGFAMIAIRPYSNACENQPCPHLEGWYVDEPLRRQGIGRALIAAAEDWCRAQGFSELGSDVLIGNAVSLDAHQRLGFAAVESVTYLRKAL